MASNAQILISCVNLLYEECVTGKIQADAIAEYKLYVRLFQKCKVEYHYLLFSTLHNSISDGECHSSNILKHPP